MHMQRHVKHEIKGTSEGAAERWGGQKHDVRKQSERVSELGAKIK